MTAAADRKEALARFADLRLQIIDLAKRAAEIQGVPAHFSTQAETLRGLASIKLASIYGEPDGADFLALRDDIEAIANKVDPLLLSIGQHAKSNSSVVDLAPFQNVIRDALDGNAGYELTAASERAEQERHLEAAE